MCAESSVGSAGRLLTPSCDERMSVEARSPAIAPAPPDSAGGGRVSAAGADAADIGGGKPRAVPKGSCAESGSG